MKAMILAAGLGTRLRPLTDKIPKALVEVDGVPMLERVITRLKSQGFDNITVNVHHFADQVKSYLKSRDWGVTINISDESGYLLDTGGGLVNASEILFSDNSEPVLIHNVDILSNADMKGLMKSHAESNNAATLLVSSRDSSRKLLFDEGMTLEGWHNLSTDEYRPEGFVRREGLMEYAFSGIYVVGKDSVAEMKNLMGQQRFSVMDYFLNPERKASIGGVLHDRLQLIDIGKPASLSQASLILKEIDKSIG